MGTTLLLNRHGTIVRHRELGSQDDNWLRWIMMWKIPLDQDDLTLVIAAAISAVGISLALF